MKTNRKMSNLELAKLLRAVAAALDLSGGNNHFRIVVYQKAADAIEHASSEVKDLWDDQKLKELPGVGEGIASSLDELFSTGKVKHFEEILKVFPPAVFELLEIPGVGPKNALKLCKALGISSAHSAISKLEKAASSGKIAHIEGFGEDSQSKILIGIKEYKGRSRRMLLDVASENADLIIEWLKKYPGVKQVDTLGSLRRNASTVGDIDLSVACDDSVGIIKHFTEYPNKSRVIEAGDRSASLVLPNQYQVDLMVQPTEAYGALLQHFTGSKHHNIALREYALKKGLSLSEYGIKIDGKIKQFSSEKDFYQFLGLQWIPPEIREGEEEIALAKQNKLPTLIEVKDIKGDLQIHSNIDIETSHDTGVSSLAQLEETAKGLGYEYIGVTEHNPAVSGHTDQQVIDLIRSKTDQVYKYNSSENKSEKRIHIFNGLEIDIQPNGARALPDKAIELLDYACVSIHSSFRSSRKIMTQRILRAMDHPKVRFLAHPTGRLLQQREGIEIDWDELFAFCVKHDKWLEIDGWPNRLDLPDTQVHSAIKNGVKIVVDTDAHNADHLRFMRYGVAVARRGWCTRENVVNTQSLSEIKKLLV
jgi:DNA polymerase (family X)